MGGLVAVVNEGSFAGTCTAIGPTRANEDRIKSSREGEEGKSSQNEDAHAVADQSTLGGVEETRPPQSLLCGNPKSLSNILTGARHPRLDMYICILTLLYLHHAH